MLNHSLNNLKKVDIKDLFYKMCINSKSLVFKLKLFNSHIIKDVGQLFHAYVGTSHFNDM